MSRKRDMERYEMSFRNRPQSKYFKAYRVGKEWKYKRFCDIILALAKDMDSRSIPCEIWFDLHSHPGYMYEMGDCIYLPGYPIFLMYGWKTRGELQDLVDAAIVEDVHSR